MPSAPGITLPLEYYRILVGIAQKHTPADIPARLLGIIPYWGALKQVMPEPAEVTPGTIVPLLAEPPDLTSRITWIVTLAAVVAGAILVYKIWRT
jgi:hypothetical protein